MGKLEKALFIGALVFAGLGVKEHFNAKKYVNFESLSNPYSLYRDISLAVSGVLLAEYFESKQES